MVNRIESSAQEQESLVKFFVKKFNFNPLDKKYVLVTGHRRENMGDGFNEIFEAIASLSKQYPSFSFVYPVHLNPRVKEPAYSLLGNIPNVYLIDPLDYKAFVYLLSNCYILLTDSGGLQEEAPSLSKPVLVMRDVTERPEAVDAKTVKLVGCNKSMIIKNVSNLLDNENEYFEMASAINPYGDGTASKNIVVKLKEFFNEHHK